jgi:hypothetical protein
MSENEQDNKFDVEGHGQGLEGDDTDVEGHRFRHESLLEDEDTEGHRFRHESLLEDEDTEGHRFRGGDHLLEDEDDVEGHRFTDTHVQPPRDADLGGTEH